MHINPWRGLENLPRDIWVLFATTLINRAGTMALPFLVLYLTSRMNVSASEAGFALTCYGIGSLVTSPFAGRLADRFGPARVMELSLFGTGVVLFVFPFINTYVAILAATFILAVISEAFRPASLAILADSVAPDRRKAAYAVNRLAINLGMSVGPAAGGVIATLSFPALFYINGITSLLAGAVLAMSSLRKTALTASATGTAQAMAAPVSNASPLKDLRFASFLTAMILSGVVFFQHHAALAIYLVRDLHLPESIYGFLFLINTLLIILLEVPLNLAMTHWPHGRSLALGALLTGAGFGALAFATGLWGVAATVVIWTFGEMILLPTAGAYTADIAPPERRGLYMGYFQMTFGLSFAIAPWAGTGILERFGPQFLWGATFICGLVSAAALWTLDSKPSAAKSGH